MQRLDGDRVVSSELSDVFQRSTEFYFVFDCVHDVDYSILHVMCAQRFCDAAGDLVPFLLWTGSRVITARLFVRAVLCMTWRFMGPNHIKCRSCRVVAALCKLHVCRFFPQFSQTPQNRLQPVYICDIGLIKEDG